MYEEAKASLRMEFKLKWTKTQLIFSNLNQEIYCDTNEFFLTKEVMVNKIIWEKLLLSESYSFLYWFSAIFFEPSKLELYKSERQRL